MYNFVKKKMWFLFMMSLLIFVFYLPEKADAATTPAKCVAPGASKIGTYSAGSREYEGTATYNHSYSTPTTPTASHYHNRLLQTSDFTSTYVHYYNTRIYSQPQKKNLYQSYKCTSTYGSVVKAGTYYGSAFDSGSATHVRNKYYSPTKYATISVVSRSGSAYAGYTTLNVVAKNPNGGSSYGSQTSYWVNKIDVTVSDDYTYEDEPYPSVSCTKYYGHNVGDRDQAPCTATVYTDNKSESIRNICYRYSENGHYGEKCIKRVYTKSVAITEGVGEAYVGQKYPYKCVATFHDGTSKNVEAKAYALSSRPYNYIGTKWVDVGYKRPDNTVIKPGAINVFYAPDNNARTYYIDCVYYPDESPSFSGHGGVSDTVREKKTTKNVTYHGIKKIVIDAHGYFASGPDEYVKKSPVSKTAEIKGKFNEKFITGHWYDFTATVHYTNNQTRDITNAPEVYWANTPWYVGVNPYTKRKSYDTNMTTSGKGHRIPQDGSNTVQAEYFNRNSTQNPTNQNRDDLPSRNWMYLDARQIKKLEIKDASGYNTPPKTTVNVDDEVKYSAWITWSDNVKEDWTDAVEWDGEYQLDKNHFDFNFRSNNNKTSVTAFYADGDRTDLEGIDNWDSNYDKIEVNIKFNCAEAKVLTWGCDIPKGNWQTEPSKYFESKNYNFLPPPSTFGLTGNRWDEGKGFRKEYPYNFSFKFNVSGVSEGNGRK